MPRAPSAVREFVSFTTPSGNKFDREYDVFSQRFHRDDFGDDKPFDPKVLPNEYLTAPNVTHTFVYVSTIDFGDQFFAHCFGCGASGQQMFGTINLRSFTQYSRSSVTHKDIYRFPQGGVRRNT